MDNQPAASAPKGLYVNPTIWRGPQTTVSDHLKQNGVPISVIGISPARGQQVVLSNVLKRP